MRRRTLFAVQLSFIDAPKPREIHDRHPDRFADVAAVYRAKRHRLDRARRREAIRRARSWIAASRSQSVPIRPSEPSATLSRKVGLVRLPGNGGVP